VRVTVRLADGSTRTLHRTVGSGGSFGASPLRLQIGLSAAEGIVALEVDWPGSGTRDTFAEPAMDRAYRIVEGAAAPEPLAVPRFDLLAGAPSGGG
jgi:hypothetical protein